MSASRSIGSVARDWRQRDVKVVLSALVIAVATVAIIALFHPRQRATTAQSWAGPRGSLG